jgi:LysR family transcriptional regulator, glycine cleavage system transcriptional activator
MPDHIFDSLPPTETLRAFIAVARTGSLSAAAQELGVTHGAVSRRIHTLQAWVGVTLFSRHGRGMRLTATGEHLVRRTERSLGAIAAFTAELRAVRDTRAVRITCLPSFARLWLLPSVSRLQGETNDLFVQLRTEHRIVELGREADIAIRFGSGDWPGTRARLLFGETIFPVAAPAVAKRLSGRAPAALLEECLIYDSDGSDWRAWFKSAGIAAHPRGPARTFVDHDLALQAARLGLGIALARMPLAEAAIEERSLVRLAGPTMDSERSHYVVTRQDEDRKTILQLVDRLLTPAKRRSRRSVVRS